MIPWQTNLFFRAADSKPTVSKETSDKILSFNRADETLFNAVNETFWRKIEKYGHQKMKNQIKKLNKMMTLWSFAYQSSGFHHSYINVSPATSMLMTNIGDDFLFSKFEMLSTDFSINIIKITLSATLLFFFNYLRQSDLPVGPKINSGNPSKVKNHIFQAGQIERLKLTFWLQKAKNLIDVVIWQWAKSSLQKLFGQNKMNIFNHWLPIQNKILNFQK